MEELIRSYYLTKLIDAQLSNQLLLLEGAILFIQNILKKAVIKIDTDGWRTSCEFYFVEDKCFFEYNIKNTYFYYLESGFYRVLSEKYHLNQIEINQLVKVIVVEHFKSKEVTPKQLNSMYFKMVEEHFKSKEVTPYIMEQSVKE